MYSEVYEFLKENYYTTTVGQFKEVLLKAYGVENHPKASMAFDIAWEHGHSSGYYEVLSFFADIVPLIQ